MSVSKTEFQEFLDGELDKLKGVYYPVRAGMLRRAVIRRLSPKKLHPNPDDEFCDPAVGPSYEIISRYVKEYSRNNQFSHKEDYMETDINDPLYVERIRPDGYMILNGHHRWAAALKLGLSSLPVRIVDLTQEMDVKKMLENAKHNKRVSLDLDEIVFTDREDEAAEKPLPFPFSHIYRERVRLGIPALFHFLNTQGYDIWLYSSNFYSADYIQRMFLLRQVLVTGVITGTGRNGLKNAVRKKLMEMILNHYQETVHIERMSVLRTNTEKGVFEDHPLTGGGDGWSTQVMDIIGAMNRHEEA